MASMREYLEKMETGQLEHFLFREIHGWDHQPISGVYLICRTLSEREPHRGSARDIFLDFARQTADNQALSDS